LQQFWELPESEADVFSLFSPADIRRIRDEAFDNLETLLLAVTSRLFALVDHASFPHAEAAPEQDTLNCIRILTRILPFIYEADQLEGWEDSFFWGARRRRKRGRGGSGSEVIFDESTPEDQNDKEQEAQFEEAKPLAEELIDVLIRLLYHSDFSIPRLPNKGKVAFTIWQSGVGCNTTLSSTTEMESRRMEVLRLLLTLASKSMYTPTSE